MNTTDVSIERRDALVARLFESMLGALDIDCVYLGRSLGLYRVLSDHGPCTSEALAAAAGTDERYTREWLEQQAVTGILEVDDTGLEATARRYAIPAGHDEVLLDDSSLNHMAPSAQLAVALTRTMPLVVDAFRTGHGVPFASYGLDLRDGLAGFNRPLFEQLLASEYLPALDSVHARLADDRPAKVLDVGCGAGWSSIALARAFPTVLVDAIDLDESSAELARENIAAAGVDDRVTVRVGDAAIAPATGDYDLVTIFEALHDMPNPVGVLRALRARLRAGGCLLVMDERVADSFTAPGDEVERFMYGCSVLHCLPVGRVEEPSAATGTVMRVDTVRRYAREAGFSAVDVLPLEHPFFRFYRLDP